MIRYVQLVIVSALSVCILSACGRNLEGDVYTSSDTVGKVLQGTIVSAREVTVKDQDDLNGSFGAIAGGVMGGISGSAVGGGTGQALATAGGAILGTIAGSVAEDALSTQAAFEYVIELNAAQRRSPDDVFREEGRYTRGSSVEDDIKSSIRTAPTQSEFISVIQADDTALAPGQPVLVVYHDDRPRVVAR